MCLRLALGLSGGQCLFAEEESETCARLLPQSINFYDLGRVLREEYGKIKKQRTRAGIERKFLVAVVCSGPLIDCNDIFLRVPLSLYIVDYEASLCRGENSSRSKFGTAFQRAPVVVVVSVVVAPTYQPT